MNYESCIMNYELCIKHHESHSATPWVSSSKMSVSLGAILGLPYGP